MGTVTDPPTRVAALAAQAAHSPAFRIRVALLARPLSGHGVALEPLPLFTSPQARQFAGAGVAARASIALQARRALRRAVDALNGTRTVLIQRQADILPPLTIERRAASGRRLVLDVDDAIWNDTRGGRGHPLAFLKGSRRKVDWLAREADTVVAGNELLAEYLAEHNADVRVIPSLVDVDAACVREHADRETLVVGWIGSATTAPNLEALRPALERMATAVAPRRLELLVVGGRIAPVAGVGTTVVEWSEKTERAALERMDIGLMPLEDTPFSRGKCAYKALQYMGSGIPVVADDIGISAQVIGHERGGVIAANPDDWVEAVRTLAADAALRARLGLEGRRRVREGFSYERWVPEIATLLRGG